MIRIFKKKQIILCFHFLHFIYTSAILIIAGEQMSLGEVEKIYTW